MNTDLMFSSATDLWSTPQATFDALNMEFGFVLDVCALPENAKCQEFLTPEMDAMTIDWAWWAKNRPCWMNPPYGREIGKWVQKAHETSSRGSMVVCLLPARTDTSWWHDYCMKGEVRFIRGRLKFGGQSNSAPFPSAVVVFRP